MQTESCATWQVDKEFTFYHLIKVYDLLVLLLRLLHYAAICKIIKYQQSIVANTELYSVLHTCNFLQAKIRLSGENVSRVVFWASSVLAVCIIPNRLLITECVSPNTYCLMKLKHRRRDNSSNAIASLLLTQLWCCYF